MSGLNAAPSFAGSASMPVPVAAPFAAPSDAPVAAFTPVLLQPGFVSTLHNPATGSPPPPLRRSNSVQRVAPSPRELKRERSNSRSRGSRTSSSDSDVVDNAKILKALEENHNKHQAQMDEVNRNIAQGFFGINNQMHSMQAAIEQTTTQVQQQAAQLGEVSQSVAKLQVTCLESSTSINTLAERVTKLEANASAKPQANLPKMAELTQTKDVYVSGFPDGSHYKDILQFLNTLQPSYAATPFCVSNSKDVHPQHLFLECESVATRNELLNALRANPPPEMKFLEISKKLYFKASQTYEDRLRTRELKATIWLAHETMRQQGDTKQFVSADYKRLTMYLGGRPVAYYINGQGERITTQQEERIWCLDLQNITKACHNTRFSLDPNQFCAEIASRLPHTQVVKK